MNKADLNRKIQILEEQKKVLLEANRKMLNVECATCAAIRQKRHDDIMRPFRELQEALLMVGINRY